MKELMSTREPAAQLPHAPQDPGDLGRRIAARRHALGLNVDEVARRAGMHSGYLEYLESDATARPNPAACARLAVALETSVAWLRGGGVERPPGRGSPPPGTPHLLELERATCLRLLEPGGIGRAIFAEERRAVALPVNFRLFSGDVVFRTSHGSIASAVHKEGRLSIEVDHLDEALGEGWSILASGRATIVTDPEVMAKVDALDIEPWAGGDRRLIVRVTPSEITGRHIRRWEAATG